MTEKERAEELSEVFKGVDPCKKTLIKNLIEECVFLEGELIKIKAFPFYRTSPAGRAYPLDALRIYKELSNQYNLNIKTLATFLKREDKEEDGSPLAEWLRKQKG